MNDTQWVRLLEFGTKRMPGPKRPFINLLGALKLAKAMVLLIEVPYICVVMMTVHNFMESGRKLRKIYFLFIRQFKWFFFF